MMTPWAALLAVSLPEGPRLIVWLVGVVVAIALWRRHAQVSALTIGGLGILICTTAAQMGVIYWVLVSPVLPLPIERITSVEEMMRGILDGLAWLPLIASIFGWRRVTPHQRSLRFSIRSVMLLTAAIAILLSLVRFSTAGISIWALAHGYSFADPLHCALVGREMRIAWLRWNEHPRVSRIVLVACGMHFLAVGFVKLWTTLSIAPSVPVLYGAELARISHRAGGFFGRDSWLV